KGAVVACTGAAFATPAPSDASRPDASARVPQANGHQSVGGGGAAEHILSAHQRDYSRQARGNSGYSTAARARRRNVARFLARATAGHRDQLLGKWHEFFSR